MWYLSGQNASIGSATLDVLTDTFWSFRNTSSFLTQMMELEKLRKLYVLTPSSAKYVKRVLKLVGFRHEGALKEGVKFDGRYVTLEIYGLLRKEVERNAQAWKNSRKRRWQGKKRPHARKGKTRWSGPKEEEAGLRKNSPSHD